MQNTFIPGLIQINRRKTFNCKKSLQHKEVALQFRSSDLERFEDSSPRPKINNLIPRNLTSLLQRKKDMNDKNKFFNLFHTSQIVVLMI